MGTEEAVETAPTKFNLELANDTTLEVLGIGEEVTLKAEAGEHGTIQITGLADGSFTSNIFATVTVGVTPETGYKATAKAIYTTPAASEGAEPVVEEVALEANEQGNFTLKVTDKCKTAECKISVSFEVIEYTITYRLNNGEYAEGESNPTTVTYFDNVTLKNVSKDGYDFIGWRAEGSTELITALQNVSSDMTIIAVFEIHEEPEEPPVTQAPVTQAPATQAPATQAPQTQAPVTQAPATQAPATQAPAETGKKKGCKSFVESLPIFALLLVPAAVVVIKRKRDE